MFFGVCFVKKRSWFICLYVHLPVNIIWISGESKLVFTTIQLIKYKQKGTLNHETEIATIKR